MEHLRLHDVEVEAEWSGLPSELVDALRSYFEPAQRDVRASTRATSGGIEIAFHLAASNAPVVRGTPIFHYGVIKGFRQSDASGGGFELSDGSTTISVEDAGRRIEGWVHERSLEDVHCLVDVQFFLALAIALRSRGLFHLHAGALVDARGDALLIVGDAGCGKTTTSLALLASGWAALGDDAIWLRRRAGQVELLAVSRPFHVAATSARMVPDWGHLLEARHAARHAGKSDLDVRRHFPDRFCARASDPKVVIYPRIGASARSLLRPLCPTEAFDRLLRSSALLVPDGMPQAQAHWSVLGSVLNEACQLELLVGQDILHRPGIVHELLSVL